QAARRSGDGVAGVAVDSALERLRIGAACRDRAGSAAAIDVAGVTPGCAEAGVLVRGMFATTRRSMFVRTLRHTASRDRSVAQGRPERRAGARAFRTRVRRQPGSERA